MGTMNIFDGRKTAAPASVLGFGSLFTNQLNEVKPDQLFDVGAGADVLWTVDGNGRTAAHHAAADGLVSVTS